MRSEAKLPLILSMRWSPVHGISHFQWNIFNRNSSGNDVMANIGNPQSPLRSRINLVDDGWLFYLI